MKNQVFTVTSAELNSLADVVIDTDLQYARTTPLGQTYFTELKAEELYIPNDSGTDVFFNIFEDATEYAAYQADPAPYEFLPIKDGRALSNTSLPETRKIVVRGAAATATNDLKIYFINYQQRD